LSGARWRAGQDRLSGAAISQAEVATDGGRQTVPVGHVLVALATCLLLSVIVDARGLIHSAQGMPDGPERTIALRVGQAGQAIGDSTHIAWVWDTLAAAHGFTPQPAVPPLLASSLPPSTARQHEPPRRPGKAVPHIRTVRTRSGGSRQLRAPVIDPRRRAITRAHPLRVLVTGDSLSEYLGPDLVNLVAARAPVRGFTDPHYGTGLVRPDYVDWSLVARRQVTADHPNAVVILLGGNDFQNLVTANGTVLYTGTAAWTKEYQRRAEVCTRIWAQGGHARVYWLSMPPARDDAWSRHNAEINQALRAAARQVPGAEYVDINGPVTNHGRYADFVNVGGQPVLVREPDGIHFNPAGSEIVAQEVLSILVREWHLEHHT
jgi:hypothetical protein